MDVPENEKELFSANDKATDVTKKTVKTLGVEIAAKPADLRIYVNGVDIMECIVLDTLLITIPSKNALSNAPK